MQSRDVEDGRGLAAIGLDRGGTRLSQHILHTSNVWYVIFFNQGRIACKTRTPKFVVWENPRECCRKIEKNNILNVCRADVRWSTHSLIFVCWRQLDVLEEKTRSHRFCAFISLRSSLMFSNVLSIRWSVITRFNSYWKPLASVNQLCFHSGRFIYVSVAGGHHKCANSFPKILNSFSKSCRVLTNW